MATTIGSFDLASLKNLRDDVTQYFWFESDSSSAWGSGAHVTLYPESQFTNSTSPNYMKGQNIIMNTDGFSIRNGGLPMMVLDNDSLDFNIVNTGSGTYTNVASFGAISTIGATDGTQSYLYQDYHSLQMFDKENATIIAGGGTGNPYFYVSDLRNANGVAEIKDSFTVEEVSQGTFRVSVSPIVSVEKLTLNGTTLVENVGFTVSSPYIFLTNAASYGDVVAITYLTSSDQLKAYSIGVRRLNSDIVNLVLQKDMI